MHKPAIYGVLGLKIWINDEMSTFFAPPGLPSSFWWGEKVGKVGILASWRESGNSHFVPTLSYFGQCTLSFAKCGSREMSHTGHRTLGVCSVMGVL